MYDLRYVISFVLVCFLFLICIFLWGPLHSSNCFYFSCLDNIDSNQDLVSSSLLYRMLAMTLKEIILGLSLALLIWLVELLLGNVRFHLVPSPVTCENIWQQMGSWSYCPTFTEGILWAVQAEVISVRRVRAADSYHLSGFPYFEMCSLPH